MAERFVLPKLSRPRQEVSTFTGIAKRFSLNDWKWKLRCWAAFLTGTRFPETSANSDIPSKTCRRGKVNTASQVGMPRHPVLLLGFGLSFPAPHPFLRHEAQWVCSEKSHCLPWKRFYFPGYASSLKRIL